MLLDERDIRELSPRQVARRLGLLPQVSIAPDGIRVANSSLEAATAAEPVPAVV